MLPANNVFLSHATYFGAPPRSFSLTTSFVPGSSMATTNNFNKPPRFAGRSIGIPHISYSYDRIPVFVARTSPALQEGNAAVPLGCFVMKTLKQSAYAFYVRTLIEATIRIPRGGWRRRAGKPKYIAYSCDVLVVQNYHLHI